MELQKKMPFHKGSGVCIFLISHYNGTVINVLYKESHSKQAVGKFCARQNSTRLEVDIMAMTRLQID